ncbi:hypothetical protein MKW94_009345 [Papaver nudicaule]|uniref:MIF4G domain-containing protein n=1 Tax=Papaver nudicaule TaxID=74823 RepID=A0AA42B045_PAPNU|nr:hypothetical protein [Papaver nudicaule]
MSHHSSYSLKCVGEKYIPPLCLMKAEVSWMSIMREKRSYEERMLRRIKGTLNKLTVAKYKLLRTQLLTPLIFEKALAEPMFCPLYDFLCSEISGYLPPFLSDKPQGKEITFRRILLNCCKELFECEREDMKAQQFRQRIMVGSFNQYLGWRWNLGFIKIYVTHFIVIQLVEENDVDRNVEAVCLLLNATGKNMDDLRDKALKKKELLNASPNEHPGSNETCFSWLKDILTTHPQHETRLKFMINDLLEFRANNWVDLTHNKGKEKSIPELISAS